MVFTVNPLSKIIALSGMLALGFLLVVLATALYGSWMPIIDGFIFAFAHIPYLLTNTTIGDDFQTGFADIDDTSRHSGADFGGWVSSFILTSGIALPIVLSRSQLLSSMASTLTVVGGLCIYVTILLFSSFFDGFSNTNDPFSM